MSRLLSFTIVLVWFAIPSAHTLGQNRTVDFRWAPESYFTVIGLPDDWQKTMVTENGSLAYDFGPGPYARNLTSVQFGLKGMSLQVKNQHLPDGKTPIVTTELETPGAKLQLTSFAIVPRSNVNAPVTYKLSDRVLRLDGINGARGWVKPATGLDQAFSNVAWGTNRAIRYRVVVERGSNFKVALGFLEGWKSTAGARPLEIQVEGSPVKTIDPLADGLKGQAYVHMMEGADLDKDGFLNVEVHPSATGPDPNTILNVFWVFPQDFDGQTDAIASGVYNSEALVHFDCGLDAELAAESVRYDIIHAKSIDGDTPLVLHLTTNRGITWPEGSKVVYSQHRPFIVLSHVPESATNDGSAWEFTFPVGITDAHAVVVSGAESVYEITVDFDIVSEIERAATYWQSNKIVPVNAIQVPDSSIQFLSDASLRNMYQVREYVNGKMQFQPGPSVYRGLWIGDFNAGAALATGDTASVRLYAETILGIQNQEGHFRTMVPNLSFYENPVFLTAAFYYARSSGNSDWLNRYWSQLELGTDWMIRQRQKTLDNPESANYGLLPAGFVDGGISELNADYGSVFWTLTALEYGIEAAESTGRNDLATVWQAVFNEMSTSLQRAMERDLQVDENGVEYLPTVVGAKNPKTPQLGSYGFIWPAKFSHFMHDKSTLMGTVVDINLKFYESKISQGLLSGAGWLADGLWHWLSAMHGSVQLKNGWREEAIETLYALSNHAAPTGTWVEEQLPAHLGNRTTGDVSNAQSSAAYYMFVRDMIAYETKNDVILFSGIPKHWLEPGKSTKLLNSHTLFGPLYVNLETTPDGQILTVTINSANVEKSNGRIIIDPTVLKEAGFRIIDNLPSIPFGNSVKYNFLRE